MIGQDENPLLHKQYRAVAEEIFRAEEARALAMAVSERAGAINSASYGLFFGTIQDYAGPNADDLGLQHLRFE
jgi:hypothetical protein